MSGGGPDVGHSLQQGGGDELGGSSVGRTGKGEKKKEKLHSDKGQAEVDETLLRHNPW